MNTKTRSVLSRSLIWSVAGALLLAGGPVCVSAAETEADLETLLSMLEGEYLTAESDRRSSEEPILHDRRVRVRAPQIGEHLIYMQINTGEDRALYRQILMVFEITDDGGISQVSWRFNDPAGFADRFDGKEAFSALSKEDVQPALAEGCEQSWRRKDDGWYGYTNPKACRIWSQRRQMFRRIESEILVAPDGLQRSERGYDDEGTQTFGTKPGEYYRLARISDSGSGPDPD